MNKFIAGLFAINLVMLINGCYSEPPKPVLPDGSHRVPVNRVPPVAASSVPLVPPVSPVEGGGR